MNERLAALFDAYVGGLRTYAAEEDELHLGRAYEMGRAALIDGLGVLEMSELHHEALRVLLEPSSPEDRARLMSAATVYFNELLSPFEMSLRGYRTANLELQRLNADLKLQKEDVEAANRELETFSYSVSHDLRSPLSGIQGLCNLILDQDAATLAPMTRRPVYLILEASEKMLQLISDLMDLARAGRAAMKVSEVDLSALAKGICERLQGMGPAREVQCVVAPGARAQGDKRLLEVVLDNLLRNAWKFTGKRPQARIEFGWEAREGGDVFHVRDNGAGFDMARRDKLFRAFSRLHSSNEFEGTGIGLTTVQRIVHRHGGEVWAEGAVAAGATFYFTLRTGQRP